MVFAIIGAALFAEVVGYYFDTYWFWTLFILGYLLVLVAFTLHTYYNGMFTYFLESWTRIGRGIFVKERSARDVRVLRPARIKKFFLCLSVVAVNALMACYIIVNKTPGISQYLLVILMANMMLYVVYYCGMKLRYCYWHKRRRASESINCVCATYLVLSLVFMLVGFYFFTMETKNKHMTASQSREKNAPCVLLFFDNHDLWHFASAAGLFFNFMMVLTLEDDNIETPWENIKVF